VSLAAPAYRSLCRVVLPALVACLAACGAPPDHTSLPIDLLGRLGTAERRAPGDPNEQIRADFVRVDGELRPALVMAAPARVTFSISLAEAAVFDTRVAVRPTENGGGPTGVTVRVGVSDDRHYNQLLGLPVTTPAWRDVHVDLGEYSGWKFSLFYHPAGRVWRFILNADATPGGVAIWVEPRVNRK
jgi:hypothetical protein